MYILNEEQLEKLGKDFKKSKKFLRYINKVYHFKDIVKCQKDFRKKQHVNTQIIFTIVFWAFLFRIKSFNELEKMIQYGCFKPLFPRSTKMPSIDAISDTLTLWDIDRLKESFQKIINILNTNKTFKNGTINGYNVCAFDGTDIIKSSKKKCDNCALMKNGNSYHYVHKAVVAMVIGSEVNYVLNHSFAQVKSEKIKRNKKTYEDIVITKSEGELTLGLDLLSKLPRWVDIVVGDALYFKAPFIREVLNNNKNAVIRIKDKTTIVYKEIEHKVMYEQTEDTFVFEKPYEKITVSYWKKDTFISDSTLLKHDPRKHVSIRIYKFIEVIETHINGKEEFSFREVYVGTTDKNMEPKTVWEIMHKRWYIENTCFHQLKTHCFLEHCFRHDDTAIEAIIIIMFMAFNLMRSFLFKRLKKFKIDFRKKKETINWFVTELMFQFVILSFLMKHKFIDHTFLENN